VTDAAAKERVPYRGRITVCTMGAPLMQALDGMIDRQAQIIAYIDTCRLIIFITLPAPLLLLPMRRPRGTMPAPEGHAALD
jgi:hypothetical protein